MKVSDITLYCAFRYALGSRTYVVSSVVEDIIKNWDNISNKDRAGFKREIKLAIKEGRAGMQMDINEWNKIIEL